MNWKAVVIGAIVFWLPELRQDPPDMGAMMPRWLLNSPISSLVVAGILVCLHGSFRGGGAKKGMMWL